MTHESEPASPLLEIIPAAPHQAPILANLLELYAHDFSEFRDLEIGADGRFGYPPLPLYWSEPGRHPFLLKLDRNWAGLALVQRHGAVWDMAEFFIVRGARRRGLGTLAVHQVWNRFTGPWEVRVLETNAPARHFWANAIAAYTGTAIRPSATDNAGVAWSRFSFESPGSSSLE